MADYRIGIFLWDGVEELDFAGPYEVLTSWARSTDRPVTVLTVSRDGDAIECSHGLAVVPDTSLDELGDVDLFLLPGGDTRPLQADESFVELVRERAERGTLMASVCTGALVYAKAGLLTGRPATTHWSALERLADLGATVDPDARFVDDGDVVTAAGVSAGIDMALHLVERLDSPEMSARIRRYIQYDPVPV